MWPSWYRVIWGVGLVVFAVGGFVGFTLVLVNVDPRTSLRSRISEVVFALVAVLLWLGLLSYFFVTFVLHDWEPPPSSSKLGPTESIVIAAFFTALGIALVVIAAWLVRSVFGPPPKWLREMEQVRDMLSGRRGKASPNAGSGSTDRRRGNSEDGQTIDETTAELASLFSTIEKVDLDPRKILVSFLSDKVKDALLFARAGRLLAAALVAVQALTTFRTVPSLARGEQARSFERLVEYEQGFPLAVTRLIIAAIVILVLPVLPMAVAWAEHEDGRLVIGKRSTRWLVAFAGYAVVASLIIGVNMLGWTGWLVAQVRDAWQQLVALPS